MQKPTTGEAVIRSWPKIVVFFYLLKCVSISEEKYLKLRTRTLEFSRAEQIIKIISRCFRILDRDYRIYHRNQLSFVIPYSSRRSTNVVCYLSHGLLVD